MSRLDGFARALVAIALLGLGIRVAYALSMHAYPVGGDALRFHLVGAGLAEGHGFREVLPPYGPTAEHPPGFEVLLAALDRLGGDGYPAHRLALGVVGTVNVVLVGLLGRAAVGSAVGVVAALIAAINPILFTADGALMSETLYGTFVLGVLLAALWTAAAPSGRRFALLGGLIALAALVRGEALALLVLLALPLALRARPAWRGRAALLGAAAGALVLVLAPWTIRNLAAFDTPVLISTNANGLFVGANCPATYHGSLLGSWRFQCYTPRRPGEDEAAYFGRQRRIGLTYAREHAGRIPVVLVARVARLFDVWRVEQSVYLNAAEGRRGDWVRRGIHFEWGVLALALAGAVLLARRRTGHLLVLLAPVAMVVLVALVSYGTTRFRHAAEPSLAVLAAVALTAAAARLAPARARRA